MTSWQKSNSLDEKTVRPGVVQTQSSSLFCCHISPSHSRVPPTPPPLYFLCLCRTIWGVQLKANEKKKKKKHEKKAAPDSKTEALLGDTETTGCSYKNQELGVAHT